MRECAFFSKSHRSISCQNISSFLGKCLDKQFSHKIHLGVHPKTSQQYAIAAPGITEIYFSSLNMPFTVVVMMCIQEKHSFLEAESSLNCFYCALYW